MIRKQLRSLCFALLVIGSFAGSAQAADAPAPIGTWSGKFSDGSGGIVLHVGADGGFYFHVTGAQPVTGRWTWNPTGTGGIVTLHYKNAGFNNRLYYSVTYLGGKSISFSDPFFRLTMYRQ